MRDENLLRYLSDDIPDELKRQRITASLLLKQCRERDCARVTNGRGKYRRLDGKTWVLTTAEDSRTIQRFLHPRMNTVKHSHGNPKAWIAVEQWKDGKRIAVFPSVARAAQACGISQSAIYCRVRGCVSNPTSDGSLWRRHTEGAPV